MSVLVIGSEEVGTQRETMSACVARRHQLPLMGRAELNVMCRTVRDKSDISIEE